MALWHLFVIFLMSTRESFVFVKTYFFPRCLTRLILDYEYLKIQRKGALHCLSSFVWSKGFLHLVCTMKTRLTYNCAHLRSTKEGLTIEYLRWKLYWIFWVKIFRVKTFLVKFFLGENFWGQNSLGENFLCENLLGENFFGRKFFG